MLLIGESLNVISKRSAAPSKSAIPNRFQEEAIFQKEKGMDYIDINLGPAKKDGHELMPWVVQTVQEVVPDVPLALDTSNIDAIEAALKVVKQVPQRNPAHRQLDHGSPGALRAHGTPGCRNQLRLYRPDVGAGRPAARRERTRRACASSCFTLPTKPVSPMRDLGWMAIVTPVNIHSPGHQPDGVPENDSRHVPRCQEHLRPVQHLEWSPEHLRPILNQTYMVMLEKCGMLSVISDPRDDQLTAIAKGQRQDIVDLIYGIMDGTQPDMGSLSKELQGLRQDCHVILGNSLYSDSWLEV